MIRTTSCPMCDNPNCYLVEFPNGTKRYRCDKCDCYYTPAWLMDENLAVLRGKSESLKTGEWIAQPSNIPNVLWKCSDCGTVIYSESEQDRKEFHKYCGKCGAVMT